MDARGTDLTADLSGPAFGALDVHFTLFRANQFFENGSAVVALEIVHGHGLTSGTRYPGLLW